MLIETLDEQTYLYAIEYCGKLIFATRDYDRFGFTKKTKRIYTKQSHAKSALTLHTRGMNEEEKGRYKVVKLKFEKVV